MGPGGQRFPPLNPEARQNSTGYEFLFYHVGGGNEEVIRKIEAWLNEGRTIETSVMAWAEFQCGPLLPKELEVAVDLLHALRPMTAELATEAGRLFRETGRRSRSLADCLIAATAIRDGAAVATVNRTDFEPFVAYGLTLL